MGLKNEILVEVCGAVLSTELISTCAVIASRNIADYVDRINPTCSNAVGLSPVPPKDVSVSGPERSPNYAVRFADDGYLGSIWVPPLLSKEDASRDGYSEYVPAFFPDDARSTVTLELNEPTDVQLVCVNNGFGAGDTRYENFGKVRTVQTWADRSDSRTTTILSYLPPEESSALQETGNALGEVGSVHIRLLDAYSGKDVVTYDPDQCGRKEKRYKVKGGVQPLYEDGCVLSASPKAGLSEIVLYKS